MDGITSGSVDMGWLSPEQLAALGMLSRKESVVKSTTMVREKKELIRVLGVLRIQEFNDRMTESQGMRSSCPRFFSGGYPGIPPTGGDVFAFPF